MNERKLEKSSKAESVICSLVGSIFRQSGSHGVGNWKQRRVWFIFGNVWRRNELCIGVQSLCFIYIRASDALWLRGKLKTRLRLREKLLKNLAPAPNPCLQLVENLKLPLVSTICELPFVSWFTTTTTTIHTYIQTKEALTLILSWILFLAAHFIHPFEPIRSTKKFHSPRLITPDSYRHWEMFLVNESTIWWLI